MKRDADGEDPRFVKVMEAFAADSKLAPIIDAYAASKMTGRGNKFGSNGLKVNGKLFAMVVRGNLVVKLPKDRVSGIVAAGRGENFDPGHGRKMKEWLTVVSPKLSWVDLAREAHGYVSGRKR
jgi:hypothetical protein